MGPLGALARGARGATEKRAGLGVGARGGGRPARSPWGCERARGGVSARAGAGRTRAGPEFSGGRGGERAPPESRRSATRAVAPGAAVGGL